MTLTDVRAVPGPLEQFDAQVLHVTFGSVLTTEQFKARLFAGLNAHEEAHYAAAERHSCGISSRCGADRIERR